ncbi:MAG: homoserine kinase [Oscillospiraceae bacterium]|nr:homoserine kinase [Oscillospiraceae bacterium]MDD4414424.1 homoserine kinase [Oscillospiraceae bacterium]
MVKITVPASSANLGAGFDALGIALTLYNYVWVEEADGTEENPLCLIESIDGAEIPTDKSNMIFQTAEYLYKRCGHPFKGLHIRQESNIPMTRGLGSSSACLVAGLLGANTLMGSPLSLHDISDLAAGLEGHPDNTAPALFGGLVTAVMDGGRVHTVSVPVSDRIRFAVFVPDFELKTEVARAVLPDKVSRTDAVYNLSRAALMTASLFSGSLENLRVAVQDRLHQPYRFPLISGAERIFYIAYELGAYATAISGAGPSVLAIVDRDDVQFISKAEAELEHSGLSGWQVRLFSCDSDGATVEFIN